MKNLLKYLLGLVILVGLVECREDGSWNNNESQYSFTIERDTDFIEKAIGERNDFKFNVKTKYDFETIPMVLKYTTSMNGVFMLDGEELLANKEYKVSKQNNILTYIGKEAGNHQVKISIKNEKGVSVTETFSFGYGISSFDLSYQGGNAEYYQGQSVVYSLKIVPKTLSTGNYKIKFIGYDDLDPNLSQSEIRFNDGNPIKLQEWYNINNIDNFSIKTIPWNSGGKKLAFTIKNETTSRDFEIQQNILARKISIQSINLNKNDIIENESMKITSVVVKSPIVDNANIFYKTWISSSNPNSSGIESTNNVYTAYNTGLNNTFTYDFIGKNQGDYTYNIQFKDEFGNESDIKQFDIKVNPPFQFEGEQLGSAILNRNCNVVCSAYLTNIKLKFKVRAGGNKKIISLKYDYRISINGKNYYLSRTERFAPTDIVDYTSNNKSFMFSDNGNGDNYFKQWGRYANIDNSDMTITATTDDGDTKVKKFSITSTW